MFYNFFYRDWVYEVGQVLGRRALLLEDVLHGGRELGLVAPLHGRERGRRELPGGPGRGVVGPRRRADRVGAGAGGVVRGGDGVDSVLQAALDLDAAALALLVVVGRWLLLDERLDDSEWDVVCAGAAAAGVAHGRGHEDHDHDHDHDQKGGNAGGHAHGLRLPSAASSASPSWLHFTF